MIRPSSRTAHFHHVPAPDERFVPDLLREAGVLVVRGFGAGPASCHFRLVYLTDEAVLGGVFGRIAAFMRAPAAARR